MADYNRNQRHAHHRDRDERNTGSRWGNDRHEYDDRDYGTAQHDVDDNAAWQSRYEREEDNRGGYGYSRYRSDGDMEGQRWGKSYGRSRDLYDRDYEGLGRAGYKGTRLGGANYGRYGNRGYGSYQTDQSRSHGRHYEPNRRHDEWYDDREDRSWWDRTKDEVTSWFGDEDAGRRRDYDRRTNHRGKGPKNYNRSDHRILEDVNDRLSDDPFVDATEIEATVSNGEVTLAGLVEDRGMKRRAEDIAEAVSGVKNVENRLRVGLGSYARNPEGETGTTSNQGEQGKARGHDVTR